MYPYILANRILHSSPIALSRCQTFFYTLCMHHSSQAFSYHNTYIDLYENSCFRRFYAIPFLYNAYATAYVNGDCSCDILFYLSMVILMFESNIFRLVLGNNANTQNVSLSDKKKIDFEVTMSVLYLNKLLIPMKFQL